MPKFFKAANYRHPKHTLPCVLWDPKADRPVFEFMTGDSGFLECQTDDPKVVALLREMGYDEEAHPEMAGKPLPLKAEKVYPTHPEYPAAAAPPEQEPEPQPPPPPKKRGR